MSDISALGELVGRLVEHLDHGRPLDTFREPIRRGSASGTVSIVPDPEEPGAFVLQVRLKIMHVPEGSGRAAFYGRLLELNHGFHGRAAFSVDDRETAWLTSAHPVASLDASEVIDLLLWTAEQADHYDDVLLGEFGDAYRI